MRRYRADLRQDGIVGERWRSADGWGVEIVQLTGTTGRRWDGTWIRVTHWGFHVADVPHPADVERWVPLAKLESSGLSTARRLPRFVLWRYHTDRHPSAAQGTVRWPCGCHVLARL